MKRVFILLFVLSNMSLKAQDEQCVVIPDPNESNLNYQSNKTTNYAGWVALPVQFHIIRQSNGGIDSDWDAFQLQQVLDAWNQSIGVIETKFFQLAPPIYIDDSDLYSLEYTLEADVLRDIHNISGALNVYIVGGDLTYNNSSVGGVAPIGGWTNDFLISDVGLSGVINVGIHEFGHYFGLRHTHGNSNTERTTELVNGSNCRNAGDRICDTPADPNLSGRISGACMYNSNLRDTNGDLYRPMVSNFMSYSPSSCRSAFTNQQYQLMRSFIVRGMRFVNYSTPENPSFGLMVGEPKGCAPFTTQFVNTSSFYQDAKWILNSGEILSQSPENMEVLFSERGKYDIKLLVTDYLNRTTEIELKDAVEVVGPEDRYSAKQLEVFSDAQLPDKWIVSTTNFDNVFQVSANVSASDDGSGAMVLKTSENSSGQIEVHRLFMPTIDIEEVSRVEVSFDYAFAYTNRGTESFDSLRFFASSPCDGSVREEIMLRGNSVLNTTPDPRENFIPNDSEWKKFIYDFRKPLSEDYIFAGLSYLDFNWEVVSKSGSNLYIDNINIKPDYSLAEPANLNVKLTDKDNVSIDWRDRSSNEIGFIIQRSAESGVFEELARVGQITTYVDQNVTRGKRYRYRIVAFNSREESDPSDVVSIELEKASVDEILLSPNPSAGKLTLQLMSYYETVDYQIFNSEGNLLKQATVLEAEDIELSAEFPPGVYVIRMLLDGIPATRKFIIK